MIAEYRSLAAGKHGSDRPTDRGRCRTSPDVNAEVQRAHQAAIDPPPDRATLQPKLHELPAGHDPLLAMGYAGDQPIHMHN
jgi:hypothetical protein